MIVEASGDWRRELREAVSSVEELAGLLGLDPGDLDTNPAVARDFPLLVPRPYVSRMRGGDPRDPLLLQVLPTGREDESRSGFSPHPLAEREAAPVPGLVHKYRGRVLFVTTGACAVHCRYCFRRHFPYGEESGWSDDWEGAIAYVVSRERVREVILSGGDPLAVSDRKLSELVGRLASIPHVERLRIHTRIPVVLPSRVGSGLIECLASTRLRVVVVLHANHAREIDSSVGTAVAELAAVGSTVLNQAVLLGDVNDSVAAQQALGERLFDVGVLPYYLHLLDPVSGAAHFEVDEERARRIHGELLARMPGYLVPRLVREVPGAPSKVPISPLLP